MGSFMNVNALFCEDAKMTDDQLDITGIFNVIEVMNKEDFAKGFSIVALLAAKGSIDCTLYFMLESSINEDKTRVKKLFELPVQLEEGIATNKTKILHFKTKNIISTPGKYILSVFCIQNQNQNQNLSSKEIVQTGERISTNMLEVNLTS